MKVHERIRERHPEIAAADVEYAWRNSHAAATRVPGEMEMRIGYDFKGRELEMLGVLLEDGWLVFHAMTPPSRKTRKEIERAERRL